MRFQAAEQGSAGGLPPELCRDAAEWHERLQEDAECPALHARFLDWLAADPRHARAYAALDAAWTRLGPAAADPRIVALRQEALAAGVRRRTPARMAAVAAAVLAVVAGGWLALAQLRVPAAPPVAGSEYHTQVGQRSSVPLADGSLIELNTDSRIEVAYEPGVRRIRLLEGQAWFQVEKDPQRPFVVEAGGQRITALGTAFDVRLGEDQAGAAVRPLHVTLLEGKVSVQKIPGALAALIRPDPPKTLLDPGETLLVGADAAVVKRKADIAKISGWREGQLVFDGDTLAAAVAEVNRYSPTQIVLADPALAGLPVSGVFKTGHARSFLETVSSHYSIRVVEDGESRMVLDRRP